MIGVEVVREQIAAFAAKKGKGKRPVLLRVTPELLDRVRREGGHPPGDLYVDGVRIEPDGPSSAGKPKPKPAPAKPKPPTPVTCNIRRLDWGGLLACEQVRLLTEPIEAGVFLQDAPHAIGCRLCQARASKPCVKRDTSHVVR